MSVANPTIQRNQRVGCKSAVYRVCVLNAPIHYTQPLPDQEFVRPTKMPVEI